MPDVNDTPATRRRVNPIVRFAVERRVTMGMCVLGVTVLGWLSLQRLPLEFLPAFSSSHISVNASYPSSSPEETERTIVRPLEDILGTINGIEDLNANASAGSGSVSVSFADGTDMNMAAVEVRDRVDRVRGQLPSDLERVTIRRFQSTDIPVLRFDLSAPWPAERLYRFVEDVVQRRLERVEGVANVDVSGLRTAQVQVSLLPDRLAAHGIDARAVATAIRANNLNLSAGTIREGTRALMVRVVGELDTLDAVRNLPLGNGLRIRDVADVQLAYPEETDFSYLDGSEALSVSVYKASTANLLAVVDGVRAELDTVRALPEAEGLNTNIYFDSSQDVRKGLSELRNSGLLGGVLAVICIFLFLRRVRTTLLAAISIPVSVIVTFVIMYLSRQAGWTDLTLNIISLMGLILAIGMLVDASIVVIESIFRHYHDLGEEPRTAVIAGASEVALPIAASTLTTVCVFLPMIFLSGGGRFSGFLQNIGTTIVIVIVASFVVAITVVPMVAAMILKREKPARHGLFDRFSDLYAASLRFTLRHRVLFAVLIAGLLAVSWSMYQNIERSFSPNSFQRQLTIQVDTPKSYSLVQKRDLYERVYDLLDARRKDLDIDRISYSFRTSAGRSRGWSHTNRFTLFLTDEEKSTLDTGQIRTKVESLLPVEAGVTFTIGRSRRGHSGEGAGVEVELVGDRMEILEVLSGQVVSALRRIPTLRDVDTTLESGDEEIRVTPNRERTIQAGLSSQSIGASISGVLSSRAASYFRTDDRERDMVVQYREQDRATLEQLAKMPAVSGRSPLPLGALADFEVAPGARSIRRENRRVVVRVTADTAPGTPAFAVQGPVQRTLSAMSFPAGYSWNMGSDFRESHQEESNAVFMLVFALVLIYMIMAALFESFAQPFTIMFSVPFAFFGVGIVMRLVGQPRDRMSDMGLIILAGIVVNNAIVLVDRINNLRWEGVPVDEAVVLGGQHRLRPIVMTALTTILGLLPMVAPYVLPEVFGAVQGRAAFWAPVGLVILGGLTTSTFFTVMVIPVIYSLVDDLTTFLRRIATAATEQP